VSSGRNSSSLDDSVSVSVSQMSRYLGVGFARGVAFAAGVDANFVSGVCLEDGVAFAAGVDANFVSGVCLDDGVDFAIGFEAVGFAAGTAFLAVFFRSSIAFRRVDSKSLGRFLTTKKK